MHIFSFKIWLQKWFLLSVYSVIVTCLLSFTAQANFEPYDLVNSEPTTTLSQGTGTNSVVLQFGSVLGEELAFDQSNGWFSISDDLQVAGNLMASGSLVTDQNTNSIAILVDSEATTAAAVQIDIQGDSDSAHIQFGSGGTFDTNLYRQAADTLKTDDVFVADQRIGIGIDVPTTALDIEGTGELIELGDGSAADSYLTFADGTDRNFGWDDSEDALSTFDQQLRFRVRQGATTPVACSATVAGMLWTDTDTGIVYSCDTSNGRNKWLSLAEMNLFGDESGNCAAGATPNSNANCNVDWGNGLGPDGNTSLGLYIPHPITITAYGFSADNDACTSGSFDVEVWSTGSNSNDNAYSLESTVASGLNGQAHNGNNLNIDVAGDQYILWGLDNNCGQGIDDWNVVLYFRYRQ